MGLQVILLFAVPVVYLGIIPAFTFLYVEPKHRHRWRRQWLIEVPEHVPGGPFRDPDGERASTHYMVEQRGAPPSVQFVAVVSLVLGHMFVPGLLMGLFGLLAAGIGLLSIPGLILAARIYRNAFGLLRCEPEAAKQARYLRDFALVLNVAIMALMTLIVMAEPGVGPLWLFFAVYAVISVLHALGLDHAANCIDAVHRGPVLATLLRANYEASTPSSRAPEAARSPAPSCPDHPPAPPA